MLPVTHPVVAAVVRQSFRFGILLEECHRLPYFLERVDGVLAAMDASMDDKDGEEEGERGEGEEEGEGAGGARAEARGVLHNASHLYRLLSLVLRVTRREGGEAGGEVSTWEGKAASAPALRCRTAGCPGGEVDISEDYKLGETVCTRCGLVLSANAIFQGDWTRCFDDDKNTSQLGPASNPLFSHLSNLGISHKLVDGVSKERLKQLQAIRDSAGRVSETAAEGSSERRTTQAYKDEMKGKVFSAMERAGEREGLSRYLVRTAKGIFSKYRDAKEAIHHVHDDGGGLTPAACLIAAMEADEFDRLKGLAAPRHAAAEGEEEEEGEGEGEGAGSGGGAAPLPPPTEEDLAAAQRAAAHKAAAELARDHALGLKGPSSRQFESNSRRAAGGGGRG